MKNNNVWKYTLPHNGISSTMRRIAACLLAVALVTVPVPMAMAAGEESSVEQVLLYEATPETAATPLPTEEPLPAELPFPSEEPLPTEEPLVVAMPLPTAEPFSTDAAPMETATPEQAVPAPQEIPAPETANAEEGIPLDSAHFPDAAFLNSIRKVDTDGNGVLSPAECEAVTSLDVRNKGITSLEGVGCFTRLTYLNCIGNSLVSLPLEQLPGLTNLLCNENQLTALDLSQVPSLRVLHCHDNRLASLDVSPLAQLQELACGDNLFTTLDVSQNKSLTYLLYLGGPLQTLTLSGNDALLDLWCSYSQVSQLDLAQAPNLEQLGIERSDLTYLDLSSNEKLANVMAGNNLLLAVHMGSAAPAIMLDGQRPVTVQLAAGQTTYDLTELGVPVSVDCISDVTGAQLTGSVLSGLQDGSVVTYRYTDGTADFTATLQFEVSNGWVEPLTLEDWTFGQPANSPHAQAEYGQPLYSYSATADGTFTDQMPDQAGTWYVKAVVPPSDGHAGLTAVTEFHILKAQPPYTVPAGLTAVYGSTLAEVDPGTGFTWQTPDQKVGDVGTRTFAANYRPADQQNYTNVDGVIIPLQITPKSASQLWISPVTNEQEAAALTVKDGTGILQQGKDYTVTRQEQNGQVTLTLTFQGNYVGEVLRSYSVPVLPEETEEPTSQPPSPTKENTTAAQPVPQGTPAPMAAQPLFTDALASMPVLNEALPGITGSKPAAMVPVPAYSENASGPSETVPPAAAPAAATTNTTPETASPETAATDGTGAETVPHHYSFIEWLWGLVLLLLLLLLLLYLLWNRKRKPSGNGQADSHTDSD